jgi:hypothetical protein
VCDKTDQAAHNGAQQQIVASSNKSSAAAQSACAPAAATMARCIGKLRNSAFQWCQRHAAQTRTERKRHQLQDRALGTSAGEKKPGPPACNALPICLISDKACGKVVRLLEVVWPSGGTDDICEGRHGTFLLGWNQAKLVLE